MIIRSNEPLKVKPRTRFIGALLLFILGVVAMSVNAAETRITVANFSAGDLQHWEEKQFSGRTQYRIVQLDSTKALQAHSQGTASGLFRSQRIDLTKTPYLNWRWRVDNILQGINETTQGGDDYPARVYVVFSGGLFFWNTRALSYVWSSHQPKGSAWPNAYTANAYMVAQRTGPQQNGQWLDEKRDIRADFRRYFGQDIATLDAVAIMTDTDNSGQQASAYYGNIYFSSH